MGRQHRHDMLTEGVGSEPDLNRYRERLFAPAYPTLSPRMLLPTPRSANVPFPFNDPSARYFYLARNGIAALARLWDLNGSEVLFPAYFHGVELEALLQAGVRLRFYPVREGMRVRVDDVISRIDSKTRAVYLIHYLGFPGPVAELAQVTRERGLLLIEDCALALLSCSGDRPLGSWGDAAIFCLYKTLPVPNGGAVVLRNGGRSALPEGDPPSWVSTLALVAGSLERHLQIEGRRWSRRLLKAVRATGKRAARALGRTPVEIGTAHFEPSNARLAMSRVSGRIVAAQDFRAIVEKRRRNYLQLLDRLGDVAPPVFDSLPAGVCPLSYPLQVRDKPAVAEKFLAHGVEAVNFWFPRHPAGPREEYLEVDELRRTVLELPCHQDLTPQTIERVASVAREVLGKQEARQTEDPLVRHDAERTEVTG
jgi:perosamine synthetase